MGTTRKRPGGTWEARWYGPDGKQHSRNFSTKGDATRHVRLMEGEKERGEYLDHRLGRTLFRDVAEGWLATKAKAKPKTFAGYESIVRFHLIPAFGATPVGRIDAAAIDGFISGLDVKPGTARNVLRVLGPVMQHAVKGRMIAANPVLAADRPRVTRPSADDLAFLTAEQVHELAAEVGPAHGTLVLTAAYTGLRAGELAALRVRHFDPLHGELRVEEAVSDVNGHLHLGVPKNGRTRRIALPAFLTDLLATQVEGRQADRFIFGTDKPLRHGNWYARYFRPAVERLTSPQEDQPPRWPAKLARLRFHDLRHTAAALLIANGEHPKAVQERLGHSSIAITMDRYGKLYPGHDAALADRLEETFQGAKEGGARAATPRP